jgi:hypothetical protein
MEGKNTWKVSPTALGFALYWHSPVSATPYTSDRGSEICLELVFAGERHRLRGTDWLLYTGGSPWLTCIHTLNSARFLKSHFHNPWTCGMEVTCPILVLRT